MQIFGLVEIKWLLSKKQKVINAYNQNGLVTAVKLYRKLYDSSLKEALHTVKEWTGRE
jgi:hypothetical protein